MASQVVELVQFLEDSRPEVRMFVSRKGSAVIDMRNFCSQFRGLVAQNILAYTADETTKAQLRAAKAPQKLCRLIGDLSVSSCRLLGQPGRCSQTALFLSAANCRASHQGTH